MDINHLIENPSKSETFDNVEKTIANQMARFTKSFENSTNTIESLKMVCALGMDLWKTCGKRVCEDTNLVLSQMVYNQNPDMKYQFQQIANNLNNNDVCVYLYLALPTIGNKVDSDSLMNLCYSVVDDMYNTYPKIPFPTNFSNIDKDRVKSLYVEYLKNF